MGTNHRKEQCMFGKHCELKVARKKLEKEKILRGVVLELFDRGGTDDKV